MALKIRFQMPTGKHPWATLLLRIGLGIVAACALVFFAVFGFYYIKYKHVVDDRLKQPIFANTAKIYAAPREVRPGQKLTVRLIANELSAAGYSADGASETSAMGTYKEGAQTINVRPGPQSYHSQDGATIRVSNGVVNSIADDHGQPLSSYELEPLLITGLSDDANRTKRRLLAYSEIPQNLINAVLAIEDRRYFDHSGVDYLSIASWAWHDVIRDRKHRGGASTLTMQLAKLLIVADTGTIRYKISQIVVAFQLEHRFSKQQIFEMYANQIPMGQRRSTSARTCASSTLPSAHFWPASFSAPATSIPSITRTAPSSAAISSSIPWWKSAPSPRARRSKPKRSRCTWFPAAWTPAKRPISLIWCMSS